MGWHFNASQLVVQDLDFAPALSNSLFQLGKYLWLFEPVARTDTQVVRKAMHDNSAVAVQVEVAKHKGLHEGVEVFAASSPLLIRFDLPLQQLEYAHLFNLYYY